MLDRGTTPAPGADAALDALDAQFRRPGELLAESAREFEDLWQQVVAQAVGDGPAAQQALDEGCLIWDGCTLALRRNPANDLLEVFCDVGLPAAHERHEAWRVALELNLLRTYPGITLGLHPDSGRLVATLQTHVLLVRDAETCVNLLGMLAAQVRRLRESGAIAWQ